jgi:hypothetical protein
VNQKFLSKVLKKIKIPKKENLDIPRRNMPQIKTKHLDKFKDWVKDQGFKTEKDYIPAKDLKPTQKDFNTKKVFEILNNDPEKLKKTILVSKDNYIIDGHHKWLAHYNIDENKKIDVLKVNLEVEDLLEKAKEFPKVRYKDIDDKVYKKTDPKLKYAICSALAKLKYNYFSLKHPNKKLRGKMFKFLDKSNYEIELLKDKKILNLSKNEFYSDGAKLYYPADMY